MEDFREVPFDEAKLKFWIEEKGENTLVYRFRYEGISEIGELKFSFNTELYSKITEEEALEMHNSYARKAIRLKIQHHIFHNPQLQLDL